MVQSLFAYERGEEEGTLPAACIDVLQGARSLLCPASVHPSDGKSCREANDPEQSREAKPEENARWGRRKLKSEDDDDESAVSVFAGTK